MGEPAGKTTQTDTSSTAQSRQVAGAAERKARARSPSPKTAYPSALSQEGPCPGSPDAMPETGRTSKKQFHTAKSGTGCVPCAFASAGPLSSPPLSRSSDAGLQPVWARCQELAPQNWVGRFRRARTRVMSELSNFKMLASSGPETVPGSMSPAGSRTIPCPHLSSPLRCLRGPGASRGSAGRPRSRCQPTGVLAVPSSLCSHASIAHTSR